MGLDTYIYVMHGNEQCCFERAKFDLDRNGYKMLGPIQERVGMCAEDMGAWIDGECLRGHKHPEYKQYDWLPTDFRVSTAGQLGEITYDEISEWNALVFAFLKTLPPETLVYVKSS